MHSPRRLAAGTALAALLVATPVAAQLLIQPGEVRENVTATVRVIEATASTIGPCLACLPKVEGLVNFSRADALTQNIHLHAYAEAIQTTTARARGALYVDFCVPRPGAGQCDNVPDPSAPDLPVNVTFKYGMVGEVISQYLTKASYGASAALIDLDRSEYLTYRDLGGISASGGQIRSVANVPLPLPNFDAAMTTQLITFSTSVRRGKIYRFQLAAFATATASGRLAALANFHHDRQLVRYPTQQGRVQLHNLTIQIGQDQADLGAQVESLREAVNSLSSQLGALGERVDALGQQFDEEFAAFSQMHADLAQRTAGQGALLLREQGAPPPEGAVFVGTFRPFPGGAAPAQKDLRVDVYLMAPAAGAATRANGR